LVQVRRNRVPAGVKREQGRAGIAGFAGLLLMTVLGWAQTPASSSPQPQAPVPQGAVSSSPSVPQASQPQQPSNPGQRDLAAQLESLGPGLTTTVWQWKGLIVDKIEFGGVVFDKGEMLPDEINQKIGQPLDPEKMRQSLRRLFDSGRYRDIEVRGERQGDRVTLIFDGRPRYFVGRVTIVGVRDERLTSILQYATRLNPGTAVMQGAIAAGTEGVKQSLEQQGFYEPQVSVETERDEPNSQLNVTYTVTQGPQARVGGVSVLGDDPGMTVEEFRKRGRLRQGSRVTHDTTTNALDRLRARFQKQNRLEATVSLQKQTYVPARRQVDFEFAVNQGPEVVVSVEGVNLSVKRLHRLVPIFEEGTIDNDLLNEGVFNIRDYVQQQGYFDAKVDVRVLGGDSETRKVVFTVDRGIKHKVVAVDIVGNKYFSEDILRERMQVKKADAYQRSGRYSPSLVNSDVNAILSLYRANGFDQASVTTSVRDTDENGNRVAEIWVTYKIDEGRQQKFGEVRLTGVDPSREKEVRGLLNAQPGQPFSLVTLAGDRNTVLTYYLSHGFDLARVELQQEKHPGNDDRTDVSLNVVEGQQVFIDRVLVSGIDHTRPSVVQNKILVHPGDPLNQSALLETQRGLYDLALFNQVVTAVQNPTGNTPQKNTLVQLTEAKRWNVTYGFGIEAQTGFPGNINRSSVGYSQEGTAGVSPRVQLDISRINFRGTQDSLTLHSAYGLLEQIAVLTFQTPNLNGNPHFSAALSGGYTNIRDITTFASSTLQGEYRVTQKWRKRDTFIYQFIYRRVKVDPNSLQVSIDLVPLLSQPVRVGGPGFTWFHDTRSPSPLNAVKGTYTSFQFFDSSKKVGSEVSFYRLDGTNSTYYQFNHGRYVLARNTRLAFANASGPNPNAGTASCEGVLISTNPTCNSIPLPERLYAGGANSLRGFPINGAGPRDLQTGYPVGGSAAIVNTTELRMPPPVLPWVGDSVSFVLFHDMGNVFQNPQDMFPSFRNFHQPNRGTCRDVTGPYGTCSFNFWSHDVGIGARYRTPLGPIRLDFSYNLNPPIYPVINNYTYNNVPHVGEANHFNFFFSIGQTF
jgi:outer membrane protein insertion porin family